MNKSQRRAVRRLRRRVKGIQDETVQVYSPLLQKMDLGLRASWRTAARWEEVAQKTWAALQRRVTFSFSNRLRFLVTGKVPTC